MQEMTAPREMLLQRRRREPSALTFMTTALMQRRHSHQVATLGLELPPGQPRRADVDAFAQLTGTPTPVVDSLLWPQVWTFRLKMALLTDRRFGLPIWSALQVRNRIWQPRPRAVYAAYRRRVEVAGVRQLEKGIEVDLRATLEDDDGAPAWVGTTTFYWRGRRLASARPDSPPASDPPTVDGPPLARWRTADGGGWRFGALTGDYNGLHWSDAYAIRFGFARALLHPGRVAAQCLAGLALPADPSPQQLDLWFRGPVYCARAVTLQAAIGPSQTTFGLFLEGEGRPAVVGQIGRASSVATPAA